MRNFKTFCMLTPRYIIAILVWSGKELNVWDYIGLLVMIKEKNQLVLQLENL